MVELVTKLLEIHRTSAKEQQPQITKYVMSHSQMGTVLFLENREYAKQGIQAGLEKIH